MPIAFPIQNFILWRPTGWQSDYERTVVINGFSKAYSMTGWRMGYICGPAEIIAAMTKLHQYGIMSAPTTSQYAAIEALRLEIVKEK